MGSAIARASCSSGWRRCAAADDDQVVPGRQQHRAVVRSGLARELRAVGRVDADRRASRSTSIIILWPAVAKSTQRSLCPSVNVACTVALSLLSANSMRRASSGGGRGDGDGNRRRGEAQRHHGEQCDSTTCDRVVVALFILVHLLSSR
jgi:hypothetical protein